MTSGWLWLLVAILFEASWVVGLRFIDGWSKLLPSLFVVATYGLGLVPLSLAGKTIAPSVLYSVWVGGGIVTVFLVDTFYFGEQVSVPKLICILMILGGAVGLKLITGGGH